MDKQAQMSANVLTLKLAQISQIKVHVVLHIQFHCPKRLQGTELLFHHQPIYRCVSKKDVVLILFTGNGLRKRPKLIIMVFLSVATCSSYSFYKTWIEKKTQADHVMVFLSVASSKGNPTSTNQLLKIDNDACNT